MRRSRASSDAEGRADRQRTRDRRAHSRAAQAVHAVLADARGRVLGRGKTGNISEGGVYMILPAVRAPLAAGKKVRVELTLPPARGGSGRSRHVRYAATLVRVTPLGKWTGVAVRFGEKLA